MTKKLTPKRARELPPLSRGQLEIMEVVWAQGETSAFEVHRTLSERREISPTTVRTTLQRLAKKGWLTHRTIGRTFFYSAVASRDEGFGKRVVDFLEDVCGGSPDQLMSALLETRGLSEDELNRIQTLIEEAGKRPNPPAERRSQP